MRKLFLISASQKQDKVMIVASACTAAVQKGCHTLVNMKLGKLSTCLYLNIRFALSLTTPCIYAMSIYSLYVFAFSLSFGADRAVANFVCTSKNSDRTQSKCDHRFQILGKFFALPKCWPFSKELNLSKINTFFIYYSFKLRKTGVDKIMVGNVFVWQI